MSENDSPVPSDSESDHDIVNKKDKKRKLDHLIEQEASDSDDNNNSSDDEDGSEDGNLNGFIEEEESGSSDEEHPRKRKRKKAKTLKRLKQRDEAELDDEDLRLVRENLGITTREEKSESDEGENEEILKDKEAKRANNRKMFGDDDSDDSDDEVAPRKDHFKDLEYESDDMDEFIVDSDDGGGGKPGRRRKARPNASQTMVGPSAYQMDEAEELFGDMEEFLQGGKKRQEEDDESKEVSKSLMQRYEPSVLTEHMMTHADEVIRTTDVPERFQFQFAGRTFPDAEERSKEAEWVCDAIFSTLPETTLHVGGEMAQKARGETVVGIENVLKFFHEEHFEPVYVRQYCKESWMYYGLVPSSIARIAALDIVWDKQGRKKKFIFEALENSTRHDNPDTHCVDLLSKGMYDMHLAEGSEHQIRDLADFITLETVEESGNKFRRRRPIRRDFYKVCRKAKLENFTKLFTMPSSLLGGRLTNVISISAIKIDTPSESPLDLAAHFVCDRFPTPEDVIKGACHLAACEVAHEPNVKNTIRELYRQRVEINTEATPKGMDDIDEFHYAYGWQYLRGQPAMGLYAEVAYLKIHRAEKEEQLTSTFEYPDPTHLRTPLSAIYTDGSASAWNTLRTQILQDAVHTFLLPGLENELREELLQKGRENVIAQCGASLREKLMVRPYTPRDAATEPFAVGIWVESGREARGHVVCLDANGELVDSLQLIVDRSPARKKTMEKMMVDFLENLENVHVVVLNSGTGIMCLDMGETVDNARRQLNRADDERYGHGDKRDYFHITFLADDIARIYSRSERAAAEFPDACEGMRAAISLARSVQNPLSEWCGLWGNKAMVDPTRGDILLHMEINPLQTFVSKSALQQEYDRVFSDVVNTIGVDVNMACAHQHASYMLQFVCGLGPVKARHLIEHIKKRGHIERREDLNVFVEDCVYMNCAGFLRIRERDTLNDSALNPLDDTRVHPESYYMAVKMCADANNRPTLDLFDPEKYSFVVEDTMFQSASTIKTARGIVPANTNVEQLPDSEMQDTLSELDLPAYASRLQQEQKGLKLLTLEDIKSELRYPFWDIRKRYNDPTEEDLLFMLNGETRQTMRIGMVFPVVLINETRDFVRVRMENGVKATIRKEHLPNHMDKNFLMEQGIPKGSSVNARILAFDIDNNGVGNALMGSDNDSLKDTSICVDRHGLSSFCDMDRLLQDGEARVAKLFNRAEGDFDDDGKKKSRSKYRKRAIGHPAFKNVDLKTAIRMLDAQPAGEFIFRPSSKGTQNLTLTWKLNHTIYCHFDIVEKGKEADVKLGNRLSLRGADYEDLDEIVARFVDPLNELVEDVQSHDKHFDGTEAKCQEEIRQMKTDRPQSFPYRVVCSTKRPGFLVLYYITGQNVHKRYVEMLPTGFIYYKQTGPTHVLRALKDVFNAFKTEWQKKQKDDAQASRRRPRR